MQIPTALHDAPTRGHVVRIHSIGKTFTKCIIPTPYSLPQLRPLRFSLFASLSHISNRNEHFTYIPLYGIRISYNLLTGRYGRSTTHEMKSLFTDSERKAMREALTYSQPTHGFNDSIDFTNSNRYGTNANGTKYTK